MADGRAFTSTHDAEVCVCGAARAEHRARGAFAGMNKSGLPFCLAFRLENPRIVDRELFRQACEHPTRFGGINWPPRPDLKFVTPTNRATYTPADRGAAALPHGDNPH